MRAPIGIRISSKRRALGLAQSALARLVGISPSYLNLIERNKRDVGGALLNRIARQLGISIDDLTGTTEHRLLADLEEALADPVMSASGLGAEDARVLVAEAPHIAAALARLHRAYVQAVADAEDHSARLRSDPLFSQLLHQILTGITAVRSSAEILGDTDDLAADERRQFLATINREAVGLTATARSLIGQFDRSSVDRRSATPLRELDDLIFQRSNYFAELEQAATLLRTEIEAYGHFSESTLVEFLGARFGILVTRTTERRVDPLGFPGQYGFDTAGRSMWFHSSAIAATRQFQLTRLICELTSSEQLEQTARDPLLTTPDAIRLAYRALGSYMAGAVIFPYEEFLAEAEKQRYDIEALRQIYTASFEQVAHRLVTLKRPGSEGVPFGFIRSDPAGRLTKHFPLPGLLLPNAGHACPLWALYTAFRSPDVLVRQLARYPDGSRYLFLARTVTRRSTRFTDQNVPVSIMLACEAIHADRTVYADGLDISDGSVDVPVGPSCRLCTRTDCASRQEEVFAPGGRQGAIRAPLLPRQFDRDHRD